MGKLNLKTWKERQIERALQEELEREIERQKREQELKLEAERHARYVKYGPVEKWAVEKKEIPDPFQGIGGNPVQKWTGEILEYSKFCGPAAVASVLNISREEAADKLMAVGSGKDQKSTHMHHIAQVLEKPCFKAQINQAGMARGLAKRRVKLSDRFYTVAEWLRINRGRVAIIRAADHFMMVAWGMVIEDNGYAPRKGRVTHVIYLDGKGE